MGLIAQLGRYAWRKFVLDGVSASGFNKADQDDIFTFVDSVDEAIRDIASIVSTGRQLKDPVRIAITTNVTLTTLVNGAVVQGLTLATGNRIATIGQTDSTTNGIRVVQASGTPIRSDDANSGDELLGATFYVNEGANAGRTYTCSDPGPIDLGTTPLPFALSGDVSTIVAKTVTGAGLATGGGPISGDPVITVGKATTKTVLDKSVDTQAVTPKAVDAKLESQFGQVFTDERYAKVLWADASGVPILALEHEGTIWARPSSLITDEYWEAAIIDANGVVIMGKPYDSAFMIGPFYDSTAKIDNAAAYVDGSGNAVALTDRVIQLTFGEVVPVAVQIQGTNAVYKMVTGSTVTSVAEDLLANTTLTPGFTKVIYEVYYGQSLSTGGATGAAITTSAFLPGRVVMPNGGIRPLGTSQDGNYATTPLPRDNIKSWVDAYERTDGNAGETPASGMAIRLAASYPSNEAILLASNGVGGQSYANIKKDTVPFNNMLLGIRRAWIMCQALGLQMEVKVHFVHGEADRAAASGIYKGYLVELQSDITTAVQAIVPGHGQAPLFVSQLANFTAPSYGNAFSWVPADQAAAAAEHPGKIILTGPRYPFATISDGIHLQAEESYKLGDMEAGAEIRAKASQPSCLRVTSAVRSGATITLTCDVPTAPIVRDTTLVTDPGADVGAIAGLKYGFRYVQTGGVARTISDVTASGSTITVTLSGDPGSPSAENLYIALDGVANNPGGPATGPRACFRDSTPGSNAYGNRYNWLAAGNIPVTT